MADSLTRRWYCNRDGYSYTARVDVHGGGEASLVLACPKCNRIGEIYRVSRLAALPESEREALMWRFGDVIQAHVDTVVQQVEDALSQLPQVRWQPGNYPMSPPPNTFKP